MKKTLLFIGIVLLYISCYSQGVTSGGGISAATARNIVNDSLDALRPIGGDPTSEISDSMQANRDRDDAAYHEKGDTLGLSGRLDLKLNISDTAAMKSGLRDDMGDSTAASEARIGVLLELKADQTQADTMIGQNEFDNAIGSLDTRIDELEDDTVSVHEVVLTSSAFKAWREFGSIFKSWPVAQDYATGAYNLADARLYLTLYYLDIETSLTGVYMSVTTQGDFTAEEVNGIALYSISGTTATKVAESSNSGDHWKQVAGTQTIDFTVPYSASSGLYMVGAIYNQSAQTDAPAIHRVTHNELVQEQFSDGRLPTGYLAAQTTFPASIDLTTLSASSVVLLLILY